MNIVETGSLLIKKLTLGPFGTNCYIIVCRDTADSVLIDAPGEAGKILDALNGTTPGLILLTHGHMDHTGALEDLHSGLQVPLTAHAADSGSLPVKPDGELEDGDEIPCGRVTLRVLHTPGHTPGSLCVYSEGCLIAGDTIFPGGPGKTWSPEDLDTIIGSITGKIFSLPGDTQIFPGHGDSTTVAREKELYTAFAARPRNPGLCGDVTW